MLNRLIMIILSLSYVSAAVTLYPAPSSEQASEFYSVKVNGQDVHVYEARVSKEPKNIPTEQQTEQRPLAQTELSGFAYWDMDSPVSVEIESLVKPVSSVKIRPLSLGLQPNINGKKISFTLNEPANFVVEVNDFHNALHLFANPMEIDKPNPGEFNVLYFGSGVHYPGYVSLSSGQTMYVAGGAVVHAYLQIWDASDVTVRGRGIIDTSTFTDFPTNTNSFYIRNSKDIKIEGIIRRDPPNWAFRLRENTNVLIDNIKIVGAWRYNTDGFGIFESNNVLLKNSFVRSFDDSILWKSRYDTASGTFPDFKTNRNVTVEGCTVWTDWGYSLGVAWEAYIDPISGILFRDCDVIHNMASGQALIIKPGTGGHVSGVEFKDIRVEDARTGLIGVYYYADDVLFDNIQVVDGAFPTSAIQGLSSTKPAKDITIRNLVINGQQVDSAQNGRFTIGSYTSNIQFETDAATCPDGTCQQGETCASCPQDCTCNGACCDGQCIIPECTTADDCSNSGCGSFTCRNPGTCSAYCEFEPVACGPSDGCCPAGCNDPDCSANVCAGLELLLDFDSLTDSSDAGRAVSCTSCPELNQGIARFDGTNYLELPNLQSLTSHFTISFRYKPNAAAWGTIFSSGDVTDSYYYIHTTDSGQVVFNEDSGTDIYSNIIPPNGWHTLTITKSGDNGENLNLYRDLLLDKTGNIGSSSAEGLKTIAMRNEPGASPYYYNGELDFLAVWNRPLSTSEIEQIQLGITCHCISLSELASKVENWKQNQLSMLQLLDAIKQWKNC